MNAGIGQDVILCAAMACAMTFALPAAAESGNTVDTGAFAPRFIGVALSDEELDQLRGRAVPGSRVHIQVANICPSGANCGNTTYSAVQPGQPSFATRTVSQQGTNVTGTAFTNLIGTTRSFARPPDSFGRSVGVSYGVAVGN